MPGLVKKSFRLEGHSTSVALEPEFWQALEQMAAARGERLSQMVIGIDRSRQSRNLASALRVFVLEASYPSAHKLD
jgi:predicted DNA-binding ribbon-helix-helix protein